MLNPRGGNVIGDKNMAGAKLNWSAVNTTNLLGLKIVGHLVGRRLKVKTAKAGPTRTDLLMI